MNIKGIFNNFFHLLVGKEKIQGRGYKKLGIGCVICDESCIHYKNNISIGNYVYIGGDAYIWGIGGIEIGDNTILGPRVTIHIHLIIDMKMQQFCHMIM